MPSILLPQLTSTGLEMEYNTQDLCQKLKLFRWRFRPRPAGHLDARAPAAALDYREIVRYRTL